MRARPSSVVAGPVTASATLPDVVTPAAGGGTATRPTGPARGRRPALAPAAIVVAFVLLASWNIGRAGYAQFYGAGARSMSMSWRALWYGSFDPAATITLDKLSGFLLPQALAARVLGFHPWVLALPEVVEGALTVLACYLAGSWWRGRSVGLAAASAAACTPLFASMFGHPMEDGLVTAALAGAFAAWVRAVRTGRWWPLLVAGLCVGVGFQAKMAQAWLVLPALVVGHLVARRPGAGRRVAALLGVVAVASLGWMALVQAVPAGQRPYVDGSTNDNVFSMVFGYNGLNRILADTVPGAVGDHPHPTTTGAVLRVQASTDPRGGLYKLVGEVAASQVGWLYPVAGAGLLAGLVAAWRLRRARGPGAVDRVDLGVLVAAAGWLATAAALLSVASVPHTAYLAAISVPLALLAGAGLVGTVRALATGTTGRRVCAALVVVLQVAWSTAIVARYATAPRWVLPVVAVASVVALAVVAAVGLGRGAGAGRLRARRPVAAAVVVAVLAGPVAWTLLVLDPHDVGGSGDAYTGPRLATGSTTVAVGPFTPGSPWARYPDPIPQAGLGAVLRYAQRHPTGATGPILLTDSWTTAAPLIVDLGADVSAYGGYSGTVANVTPAQLADRIAAGRVGYVLLGQIGERRRLPAAARADDVVVVRDCRPVPTERYREAAAWHLRLYSCAAG